MNSTRKKILLWILITNLLLLFGGSINPLTLAEQLSYRIRPSILLEPNNPKIQEFNIKIENAARVDKDRTGMPDNIENPESYEIRLIEAYVLAHIEWTSDLIQYLAVDHLAPINDVLGNMKDDCDGRAIFAASLLLHRGYDAWVVVSWYHWWVEVLLENELAVEILTQGYNGPWYMKFNTMQKVFRGSSLIGFVLYNFALAALIPFLLPFLYGALPQDEIFKLLLLLLVLIPLACLLGFHLMTS